MSKAKPNEPTATTAATTATTEDKSGTQAATTQGTTTEQKTDAPATQDPKPANQTLVQEPASELAPHQRLELRAFGEMLDEYAERYIYKDQEEAIDRKAHRKLHAAVRMLLNFDNVVLKEAYAMLLNRMSQKHKFNAFGLPVITKYLHDASEIKSSSERVFIAEFLTISSQFSRMADKSKFRSQTNLKKVLQSISDEDVRKRIDSLFPG